MCSLSGAQPEAEDCAMVAHDFSRSRVLAAKTRLSHLRDATQVQPCSATESVSRTTSQGRGVPSNPALRLDAGRLAKAPRVQSV